MLILDAEQHRAAATDRCLAASVRDASLVLAGSSAVVWASRLSGGPVERLPTRITPLALVDAVCAACNADALRVFILGGAAGRPGVPGEALRASAVLGLRHRGMRVAGSASLQPAVMATPDGIAAVTAEVCATKPDVVLVSLPEPAATACATALRVELPGAWFVESPALISAVLGDPRPARATTGHAARLLAGAAAGRLNRLLHVRHA